MRNWKTVELNIKLKIYKSDQTNHKKIKVEAAIRPSSADTSSR